MLRRLLLVALVSGCADANQPPDTVDAAIPSAPEAAHTTTGTGERPEGPAGGCMQKWDVTRETTLDTVPLEGSGLRDFPKQVRAVAIAPGVPPDGRLASNTLAGQSVFFTPPGAPAAVVDAALFGDLAVVDATGVRRGDRFDVGVASPAAMAAGPRAIAELLVRAGVIRPFIHVGGTVCLRREAHKGTTWTGEFDGEHVYFTNEENREPLAFTISIDGAGGITVAGG